MTWGSQDMDCSGLNSARILFNDIINCWINLRFYDLTDDFITISYDIVAFYSYDILTSTIMTSWARKKGIIII